MKIESGEINEDLIAITSYFNPSGYKSKKKNFKRFANRLRKQGIMLLAVECSFHDNPHELDENDAQIIIRVKSNSRIWQKERLLNIGLENIPKRFNKFCALDCDILFENDRWARQAADLLETYPAVQPFSYSYRLRKDEVSATPPFVHGCEDGQKIQSFAKGMHSIGKRKPKNWFEGGHTGFAWAFRKDSFPCFYDRLIAGGGDNLLAYALFGFHSETICVRSNEKMIQDQKRYVEKIYRNIRGNVGFVSGMVVHLWHGKRSHRKYNRRFDVLLEHGFDPLSDLRMNEYGCWEVGEDIERGLKAYFDMRKEDGEGKKAKRSGACDKMVQCGGFVMHWKERKLYLKSGMSGSFFSLNRSAALIWMLCDQPRTAAEVADLLACLDFDGAGSVARDTKEFLWDFRSKGLVRCHTESDPRAPTVKRVAFCGFWEGFDTMDNYFLWTLVYSENFNLMVVDSLEERIDFLFFSEFSPLSLDPREAVSGKIRKIQVCIDAEPDFAHCDYAFSPHEVDRVYADRHFRMPLWSIFFDWAAFSATEDAFRRFTDFELYKPRAAAAHLRKALF